MGEANLFVVGPCHSIGKPSYARSGVGRTRPSRTWSGPDGSSHSDSAAGRPGSHPPASGFDNPCL